MIAPKIPINSLAAALAVLFLTGGSCGDEDSATVRTSEISATLRATAEGNGETTVYAELERGYHDLELTGGDILWASSFDPIRGTVRQYMSNNGDRGRIRYGRRFRGDEKDMRFEVDLDRDGLLGTGELESYVTLPTPFSIRWVEDPVTLVAAPLDFSRSGVEPRFVVWDPYDSPDFEIGDRLSYEVTGPCIERYAGSLDWEGGVDRLELSGGVLRDRAVGPAGESCAIDVEIRLLRVGIVDTRFEGGTFYGQQIRRISLFARP